MERNNTKLASSSGTTHASPLISLATTQSVTLQEEPQSLGPKKIKYKRNDVSLAPVVGRTAETVPLRFFSAPTYNDDKEAVLSMSGGSSGGHGNRRGGGGAGARSHSGANGLLKSRSRKSEVKDALAFCQQFFATTLTDGQAEDIVYPYAVPNYSIQSLVDAICERMTTTAARLSWNRPVPRPDWVDDLRFLGDWWICLSDPSSKPYGSVRTALNIDVNDPQAVYRPLLNADSHTDEDEEQLIADLALRLQGQLYHLEVLHIDRITLTPDRLQVLLFSGLVKRRTDTTHEIPQQGHLAQSSDADVEKRVTFAPAGPSSKTAHGLPADVVEDALSVLSLSICNITAAGALIILAALAGLAKTKPHITTLDLSFNVLTHRALGCFARILPLTRVVRLSLRGNPLTSPEPGTLREFLREGAGALQELDLGCTRLSYTQVCTLIECLPELYALRVLLLDYVDVPREKASALSRAIIASRLWHISLTGVTACESDAYMAPIREACDRHRREAMDGVAMINSFFQRFFQQSYAKGWRPPIIYALPEGYGVFTNNDPSLHSASAATGQDPIWLREDGA